MAVNPSSLGGPKPQYEDANGIPASGYKLFWYVGGSTSTKQNTYTDATGATPNANPIILNSLGEPPSGVFFTAGLTYTAVFALPTDTDPPTTPIWSVPNIKGINDTTVSQSQWVSGPTPTFISGTSFTLAGDQTSIFTVGLRLQIVDASTTKYRTISISSYDGVSLTTVTVVNDGAALTSPLSAVSYGLLSPSNTSLPFVPVRVTASASNTILLKADQNSAFIATGTFTQTLTAAATLGAGWYVDYRNDNTTSGIITLDPNGGELIDGLATINLYPGEACRIFCDGAAFKTEGRSTGQVFIATYTAAAVATLDITGLPQEFRTLLIQILDLIPATAATNLFARISQATVFKTGAADYGHCRLDVTNAGVVTGGGSGADNSIILAGALGAAAGLTGEYRIFNNGGTTSTKKHIWSFSYTTSTPSNDSASGQGLYAGATSGTPNAAVDGIRFGMTAGNITSAVFTLYGIR